MIKKIKITKATLKLIANAVLFNIFKNTRNLEFNECNFEFDTTDTSNTQIEGVWKESIKMINCVDKIAFIARLGHTAMLSLQNVELFELNTGRFAPSLFT